jgi:hypothetical protein
MNNLPAVFDKAGESSCSMVVRATYNDLRILDSELLAGPFVW